MTSFDEILKTYLDEIIAPLRARIAELEEKVNADREPVKLIDWARKNKCSAAYLSTLAKRGDFPAFQLVERGVWWVRPGAAKKWLKTKGQHKREY